MFRRLAVLVGLLVLGSGCSSAGSAADESSGSVAGPAATEVAETTTPVSESVETTVAGFEFADVIEGEPPSTTISNDPDAQAAVDAAYWYDQIFVGCYRDLEGCRLDDFAEASAGPQLSRSKHLIQGRIDRGGSIDSGAAPAEYRAISVTKSDVSDIKFGVVACTRNYFVARNADGEVIDDTSPAILYLRLVERDSDDRWYVVDSFEVSRFQPASEGGDACSMFDGSEVTDQLFDELVN